MVVIPSFGAMPADIANTSYDLLAAEVVPELQRLDVGGDVGVTYEPVPADVV
jgi:hypothetical protein